MTNIVKHTNPAVSIFKESKESLTPLAKEVLEAHLTEKTFSDLDNWVTVLRTQIAFVCTLMNLKELPNDIQMSMITKENNQYKFLTPKDFTLAFVLNERHEYPEYIKGFGCFDLSFMSQVLKAYKNVLSASNKELSTKTVREEVRLSSDEELYDKAVLYTKETGVVPSYWNWTAVYRHMKKTGLTNQSQEYKDKIRKKVELEVEAEKLKALASNIRLKISDDSVNMRCKELAVKEYLEGLKVNG